jgi:RNA-directed DNA polymerase
MGKLFNKVKEQKTLYSAWRKIKSNGLRSTSFETRTCIEKFDRDAIGNIKTIQRLLRTGEFKFDPQSGVTVKKASGGKRGIVMASVQNRIVERALLDTLQQNSKFVQAVNSHPTSVGGVPNRSVPHALQMIDEAFRSNQTKFVRSDISGFFDHIPRSSVLDRIAADVDDDAFNKLLRAATTTTLANESALGEDRSIFPTNNEGVAQGSPLSPLFGNILLYDFDIQFNDRGVICIRFIDDFLLLSTSAPKCKQAFISAKKFLKDLNLDCHDPFLQASDKNKTEHGDARGGGFWFLGYDCQPGLFQPSPKARSSILKSVDEHFANGRSAINGVRKAKNSFAARQRYAQTQTLIDQVLRGWGEAFAYSTSPSTMKDLDKKIDVKIDNFRKWYTAQAQSMGAEDRRRTGGIGLLADIKPKFFEDAPIVIPKSKQFRRRKSTVTISTDGSVLTSGKRRGKDQGPGGWAFIVHEPTHEESGSEPSTTNNRMELSAVLKAVQFLPIGASAIIRTDSQYVENGINNETALKTNLDLWTELQDERQTRNIKVVWLKGHAGDFHNERADELAGQAASNQGKLNR